MISNLRFKDFFASLISFLTFFLLLLQFTNSYKLLLLIINQQTYIWSIFLIIFFSFYIIVNNSKLSFLFKVPIFFHWLCLIFFLPIILLIFHFFLGNISLNQLIYWLGIYSLAGGMFCSSSILFFNYNSSSKISIFYISAFIITVFGVWLSIEYYDIIRAFMTLNRATEDIAFISSEKIRVVGFFDHPNMVSRAFLFSSIIILGTYFYDKSIYLIILFIVLLLVCILFTGSRTVFILFFLFLMYYFPRIVFKDVFLLKSKKGYFLQFLTFFTVPIFALLIIFIFYLSSSYLSLLGYGDIINRFTSLIEFNTNNFDNDVSANYRYEVIFQYLEYILKSPFFGYGPSLRNDFINRGIFSVASQNQFLEDSFSFGILYVLYFIFVFFKTIYSLPSSFYIFNENKLLFYKAFLYIVLLYCFSVNYLLINEVYLIAFGSLMGISILNFNSK